MDTVELVTEGERVRLVLPASVSTRWAQPLRDAAIAALAQGRDVEVDASAVTGIGTAALQILTALSRGVAGHGHTLWLRGGDGTVERALALSGFDSVLGVAR